MNLFPKQIKLKGKLTLVTDLINQKWASKYWETEFVNFLKEWYDGSEFISVQTSGSTGKPKTISLKKEFVAESALRTLHYFQLKKNDKVLHCLPSAFIAGKLMIVRSLLGNLDLHLSDPSQNFEVLENNHFKFAAMVPNQVKKLINLKSLKLNQVLIGGDAIPLVLEKELLSFQTACYSSYGMTETATHIALRRLNGIQREENYHCLEGITVKLSKNGTLIINYPGKNYEPIQTNDIATLFDEKTFKIRGRSDNIIISGGIKYSPEEIEKKLDEYIPYPFLISSLPHETLGRQIILKVESKPDPSFPLSLKQICKKILDKFEQPRQIILVDEIPKTKSGKIARR